MDKLEWQVLEYTHYEKPPNWYWWVAGGGLLAVILAMIFSSLLFAILLLLATLSLLLYGARHPELITVALHRHGVQRHKQLYPYQHLKSFWIHETPERPRKIILTSEKIFLPHIVLPLHDEVESAVAQEFLLQYLPEEHQEEALIDLVSDYLGF